MDYPMVNQALHLPSIPYDRGCVGPKTVRSSSIYRQVSLNPSLVARVNIAAVLHSANHGAIAVLDSSNSS